MNTEKKVVPVQAKPSLLAALPYFVPGWLNIFYWFYGIPRLPEMDENVLLLVLSLPSLLILLVFIPFTRGVIGKQHLFWWMGIPYALATLSIVAMID